MYSALRSIILLALIASSVLLNTLGAQMSPLQHQRLLDGIYQPTSLVFLPDGRALIASLNGRVWITSQVDQLPISMDLYLNMDTLVDNNGEHGLLEIILDPDFQNNDYLYLYYSTKQNKNRLGRFVHLGDSTAYSTETTIFETYDDYEKCCHVGGAMSFLNDGTIILSVGDDFRPTISQDLSSAFGKTHRFNPDGTIPTDNPFYDNTPGQLNANGELKSIYAYGLRNPFRGAYDSVTEDFLIGEVGGNDHTSAWEDTHRLSAGANFGWPFCGAIGRDTSNGDCNDPAYDDPIFSYPHEGTGASVTSGCFYRSGASNWSSWEGRYIYGDYAQGWLKYVDFDPSGNPIAQQTFLDTSIYAGVHAYFVVKLLVGPGGDIYYLTFHDGAANTNGVLHRLINSSNQLPVCDSIWASPTFGGGPTMQVDFNGSAYDPEGLPLSYSWYFDDGSPVDNTLVTSHLYASFGAYNAELIVADDENETSCGQIPITVGVPPTVDIVYPPDSSKFIAGETITFFGQWFDNGVIDPSDVQWEVVFNHDQHTHPVNTSTGGSDYDLIIPTNGHDFSGNTYYTIKLTVTDQDGLTRSKSISVFPEKQDVTFDTSPSGLEVMVNGIPYVTPYTIDHVIGFDLIVSVPNAQQCSGDFGYLFDQWSDGQPPTFLHTVNTTHDTIAASFSSDGFCSHCGIAVDFDGVNDVISIDDSLRLSGDFTFEFWLQLDPGISVQDAILGNDSDLSLDMASRKIRLRHGSNIIQSSLQVSANVWNHFALVRDAGSWSIYLNGVEDQNANVASGSTSDMLVTMLGKSFLGDALDGTLDEFRVWGSARSASEIQGNMDVLVDPADPDLLLYWRFDQQPGAQNVLDISNQGVNGFMGTSALADTLDPTLFDPVGPLSTSCTRDLDLNVKLMLEGPYQQDSLLMIDILRSQGILPINEPYSNMGFPLVDAGGESTQFLSLLITGDNALVDWVVVELRDTDDPTIVLKSIMGLVQRDGDVVSPNGLGPLTIRVDRPDLKIAVRHRNHLGVMTQVPVQLGPEGSTVSIDFSDPALNVYGNDSRVPIGSIKCLWTGDSNGDGTVKYAGALNDRDPILVDIGGVIPTNVNLGYSNMDLNLDGKVKYSGPNNDRDLILINIGGSIPTAIRTEQLP